MEDWKHGDDVLEEHMEAAVEEARGEAGERRWRCDCRELLLLGLGYSRKCTLTVSLNKLLRDWIACRPSSAIVLFPGES